MKTTEVGSYGGRFIIAGNSSPQTFNPVVSTSTYSADIIIIQMTISIGRTVEKKQALFKRIVEELHRKLGVRPDDVMINIVETTKENWSFGKGIAQYVT